MSGPSDKNIPRGQRFLFIVLLLLLISAALIGLVSYPFVFVLLLWLGALIYAAWNATTANKKAVCINLAAVAGLLLALEAHWVNKKEFRKRPVVATNQVTGFSMKDPLLGYTRAPNYSRDATKTVNGQASYSVTYTTDSSGYRITPQPENPLDDTCMIFLGCSFTFGDGVNDAEAMPYQVAELSNRKTINLGVSGYGPHHMLAAIEFDLLPDLGDCSGKIAVYQAIEDHVSRAAGLGHVGEIGPRYVISETGQVVYAGQYGDRLKSNDAGAIWGAVFGKSYIYQEYFVERYWVGEDEIELYLAIVAAAKSRLQQKFPGVHFIVLYWDTSDRSHAREIEARLPEIADEYIRVSEIIPGIDADPTSWLLPLDPHPNAKAHRAIAEHLTQRTTQ